MKKRGALYLKHLIQADTYGNKCNVIMTFDIIFNILNILTLNLLFILPESFIISFTL